MSEQAAIRNRARLLAFCERLAAAVDRREQAASRRTPQPCSDQTTASAREQVSTAAAPPPYLSALQLELSGPAATDASAVQAPETPRKDAQCSSGVADSGAVQLLQNAESACGDASIAAAASAPAACAAHADSPVQATPGSRPQPRQHDEPPAPQTPQKLRPVRPAAAASPRAESGQRNGGLAEPALVPHGSCAATTGACTADAGCTAAPASPPQLHAEPGTEAASAEATQPVDEAEAVALTAACALASLAPERSAAGQLPWPLYFIATRDCFTFELVASAKQVRMFLSAKQACVLHLGVPWTEPLAHAITLSNQLHTNLQGGLASAGSCASAGDGWQSPVHAHRVLFQARRSPRQLLRGDAQLHGRSAGLHRLLQCIACISQSHSQCS